MTPEPSAPNRYLDPRIAELLTNGSREQRVYLCSLDPKYFAIFYFPEYFDYALAEYHFDFFEDCRRLVSGELDEAMWVAYRESAKTSIAKIAYICWAVCCGHKRYVNVDSYDKANAESILADVAVALQSNQRIIADFGQLYYKKAGFPKGDEEDEGSKAKRLDNFVTENGVKVEAHSTQESVRGRLYKNTRPDCFLFDDFENLRTAESGAVTAKVIGHMDEVKAGLAAGACALYLANRISDEGSVSHVEEGLRRNPGRAVVRDVPVMDVRGNIAWPDKYVKTDAEAAAANAGVRNPRKRKVSLEAKLRVLGQPVFAREMLNSPGAAGDYYFDREKVKRALAKAYKPTRKVGDFSLWFEYDPSHKDAYAIGADTAEGRGDDANASAAFDFAPYPRRLVGSYCNNRITARDFGYELKNQGQLLGEALIAVEMNQTGYATNATLNTENYPNLYQQQDESKVRNQTLNEYGWRSNRGRKRRAFDVFKADFEAGAVEIFDEELLSEMLRFLKSDLSDAARDTSPGATSRHFDRLIAAVIGYDMADQVTIPPTAAPASAPRRPGQRAAPSPQSAFKSPQKPWEGLA
jgi:hypothetical protein